MKEQCSLLYRADAPRPSSVDIFLAKERKPSSSLLTTARQRGTVMRSREKEKNTGAGVGPSAKAEDSTDVMLAVSDALQSKARAAYQMLKVVMEE